MDTVQIMVKRGDSGSLIPLPKLSKKAKVSELFKLVQENMNLPGSYSLIYGSNNLHGCQEKTLEECKIKDKATVVVVFKLKGGPSSHNLMKFMMENKTDLKELPGYVTLTTKKCMILLSKPDGDFHYAEMFCGHVISPEGMTGHALSIVKQGRYQFHCPNIDDKGKTCGREWPFFVVKHVSCFLPKEREDIEVKLAVNYMEKAMGVQKCPGCLNYCQRENPKSPRVSCPVCSERALTAYEFCWYCKDPWTTSGQIDCGNLDCDGNDDRIRYLKNCPKTTIYGVSCPSVRACPDCGNLINHIEGCNNMTCTVKQPHYQFCFICLKKGNCGGWCNAAPVQTFTEEDQQNKTTGKCRIM